MLLKRRSFLVALAAAPALALAAPRKKRCVVVKVIKRELPNGKVAEAYASEPGVSEKFAKSKEGKRQGYKVLCVY